MKLDPAGVADVRAWLRKASRDLLAAENQKRASPPLFEQVVFHAQQSVEKALKGFLALHDRPFRKTHDLVELGRACAAIEPALEPALREAAPLTEYAWKFRYPGDLEEPTAAEAERALQTAHAVVAAILDRMPSGVRP